MNRKNSDDFSDINTESVDNDDLFNYDNEYFFNQEITGMVNDATFPDLSDLYEYNESYWFNTEPLRNNQYGGNYGLFTISNPERTFLQRWGTYQYRFNIRFNNLNLRFDILNQTIIQIFNQIYEMITNYVTSDRDRVRVIFNHHDLNNPVNTDFLPFHSFNPEMMLNLIDNVTQSGKSIQINNEFKFWIDIVNIPSGSSPNYSLDNVESDLVFNSNCVKFVANKDNYCAIRALLIAKVFVEGNECLKRKYTKIESKELDVQTLKVVSECNLLDRPISLEDMQKLECSKIFKDYQLNVINRNGEFIFKGQPKNKFLYIWLSNSHYFAITNISRFFRRDYYCDYCKVGYQNTTGHRCNHNCKLCNRQNCISHKRIICNYCGQKAFSETCLKFHIENNCIKAKICEKCNGIKSDKHVCTDQKWCSNCQKAVEKSSHQCYVLTEDEKNARKLLNEDRFSGYVFFDYEASQENIQHEPNLICAKKICSNCLDTKNNSCKNCGKFQFRDNYKFCVWLFKQKNHIAIAHNMKGYDGVFIMNFILHNIAPGEGNPVVIAQGSKLLTMKFRSVKIIDSFSFIPVALSNFSKAFGISELKKGFFPHLFNTENNQNYIGPYPSADFFGVKYFTKEKIKDFYQWYTDASKNTFDFKKELEEYCWSDVELLAEGCLAFRQVIKDLSKTETDDGIDPFRCAITIASLCHLIYRKKFLKPNTLPFISENMAEKNNSFKSNLWLSYLAQKNNQNIEAALNGGERKIGEYYVDGYNRETDTVYEFHGCYFHGCPKCFSKESYNKVKNSMMGTIYKKHLNRIEFIRKNCTNLVEIWECEFDKLMKKDKKLIKFSKKFDLLEPLNPRDALFGGRTNAIKLFYKAKPGEKIYYFDFTSLYPYVQKYCRYPVGHPTIIKNDFDQVNKYFGIIKCKILPPKGLYLPVLPQKINGKLVFTLCEKCAKEQITKCNHSDQERSLTGTWVTLEVQKAIELGYKVEKIYEIWHWNETEQYDPFTKSGGIFTPYINTFLKGKQEASGFPSNVKTYEQKLKYVQDYFDKEGILLDINNIERNEAKRFVFKLALNSMWGRLGMNMNRSQCKIIKEPEEWFKMISDDQNIITNVQYFGDTAVQVFFKTLIPDDSVETSVTHAAFVTAHARLKLYSELEKIGSRILYFDTDSMIFKANQNDYIPKLGDFLGELTNEIDSDDYITEFVSAGPKNYGYITNKGKTECKCKGFQLYDETREKINFESIKRIVTTNQKEKIEVDQLRFKRDKRKWEVSCENEKKIYGFVYDKRVLFDDLSTLPFGY